MSEVILTHESTKSNFLSSLNFTFDVITVRSVTDFSILELTIWQDTTNKISVFESRMNLSDPYLKSNPDSDPSSLTESIIPAMSKHENSNETLASWMVRSLRDQGHHVWANNHNEWWCTSFSSKYNYWTSPSDVVSILHGISDNCLCKKLELDTSNLLMDLWIRSDWFLWTIQFKSEVSCPVSFVVNSCEMMKSVFGGMILCSLFSGKKKNEDTKLIDCYDYFHQLFQYS